MLYVEWLRVRNALKWTAIVLGVLLAIAVIVRVAVIGQHDYLTWALDLKADPGTATHETILPDGTRHIEIDDPGKKVRVVIDDRGSHGKHIEIYDFSEKGSQTKADLSHDMATIGSVNEKTLPNGGKLFVVDTNGETNLVNYLLGAAFIGLIVATVLGAPFARENDGHLEVTLTKPISREMLAIGTLGIDIAGLIGVFVLGIVFEIVVQSLFEGPHISIDAHSWVGLGAGLLAPIAWYAMLTAATASLKRGWGTVLGFAWPVALIVVGLSHIHDSGNVLLMMLQGFGKVLSTIDPAAYMHFGRGATVTDDGVTVSAMRTVADELRQVGMLGLLAVVYSTLAVIQWRRVEA
jgi:hypothetical protein